MQDRAGNAVLAAFPAEQASGPQARVVEEYERSLPAKRLDPREALATQILGLTGQRVSLEGVYADADGRLTVAGCRA